MLWCQAVLSCHGIDRVLVQENIHVLVRVSKPESHSLQSNFGIFFLSDMEYQVTTGTSSRSEYHKLLYHLKPVVYFIEEEYEATTA